MASKHTSTTPALDRSNSSSSAHRLPPISLTDRLLAFSLPLSKPFIAYSVFVPRGISSDGQNSIESARRQVVRANKPLPIWHACLPSVRTGREPALYVFSITSQESVTQRISDLTAMRYDGLISSETSSFAFDDIYPCYPTCSTPGQFCLTCSAAQASMPISPPSLPSHRTSPQSVDNLLPRQSLRLALSHFLQAVRDRLIDDFADSSKTGASFRPVTRMQGGFLLGPQPPTFEWGVGWEHYSLARPMVYCQLEVILAPSRLIIHPILRSTHFIPLHTSSPSPGLPIVLIPHATPAYFIAVYDGPASTITTQFDESLAGLGIGDWKGRPGDLTETQHVDGSMSADPLYIIAWINVEDNLGEEKGIAVIWPARLCCSFLPSSTSPHARVPLTRMPELPPQLQSLRFSPPLDEATPSPLTAMYDFVTSSKVPTAREFHSLISSKPRGVCTVAAEVGTYVDAIAKERERERERIRRERENVNVSQSPRGAAALGKGNTSSGSQCEIASNQTAKTLPLPQQEDFAIPTSPGHQDATQLFYPSPPQSTLPSNGLPDDKPMSPEPAVMAMIETPGLIPSHPGSSPEDVTQVSGSTSFDPFGNFEPPWSQVPDTEFMHVDFGISLSTEMDPITSGVGGGRSVYDRSSMAYNDSFTDDDFSFFDQPSRGASAHGVPPLDHINLASVLDPVSGPTAMISPPLWTESGHISPGSHPSAFIPVQQLVSSPWGHERLMSIKEHDPASAEAYYRPTPVSQPAPESPIVHLSDEYRYSEQLRSSSSHDPSMFDPVPFASSHRVADGKYAAGKFALPTPPNEEMRRTFPSPPTPPTPQGWRSTYNTATDPRLGMMRKLRGVKRKIRGGGPPGGRSRSRNRELEDWAKPLVDGEDDIPEVVSEEEDIEINDFPTMSRSLTPSPPYVPLGPTLLHGHFKHFQLLPLSKSLRPPGVADNHANVMSPPAPISVPTPVSPAAIMGATSERTKLLESIASLVAREAVENPTWYTALKSNTLNSRTPVAGSEIWQTDVKAVSDILESISEIKGPLDIETLFRSDPPSMISGSDAKLEPLEPPMISVGKGETVIQASPSALRFWDKLGLRPRGGQKDVTAFVFYEDEGEERHQEVENWLGYLSTVYSGKNLGKHVAGSNPDCPKNGLVPLRLDGFRKSFLHFMRGLSSLHGNFVFYIVIPSGAVTLASPLLRQIFSTSKRAWKAYPATQILFQFIPSHVIADPVENCSRHDADLETVCFSVYNRIPQAVDRSMSRRFTEDGEKVREYIQDPAFALARSLHHKVRLLWQASARPLDVADRHTLLHVGYQMTSCGKWILAVCVDQRGETHDIGVWLTPGDFTEVQLVTRIWEFAIQFACRASVEWRLAIAKLGTMGSKELDAWITLLGTAVPVYRDIPIHVSLLCVDRDAPWTFITPTARPEDLPHKDRSSSFFVDITASSYMLLHTARLPLSSVTPSEESGVELSFVSDGDSSQICEDLSVLPLSTTKLIRVPNGMGHSAISMLDVHLLHTVHSPFSSLTIPDRETHTDITRNYHELSMLADYRWKINQNPLLPFHLAALDAMNRALDSALDR